jgi:quinolinate synthase
MDEMMDKTAQKIEEIKKKTNAVILAHTYQPPEIQDCADYVGDSYGLSVQATKAGADTIIFCGVLFMAETAAILNPEKKVTIPEPEAGCPMAEMIDVEDLVGLKRQYPDYTVLCYVNSTAEIKALSDICCTSSNALKIVQQIPDETGVIFVPDKYLGDYIQQQTGHTMVMWKGFCPTHARITATMIQRARNQHPHACVMIHPEAPREARALCDRVLSTGGMCTFAGETDRDEFIVATEKGILHTLTTRYPDKTFFGLDEEVVCPNMKKGSLDSVRAALEGDGGAEVTVEETIAKKARISLEKMLAMSVEKSVK